jgi:hypothetical protein
MRQFSPFGSTEIKKMVKEVKLCLVVLIQIITRENTPTYQSPGKAIGRYVLIKVGTIHTSGAGIIGMRATSSYAD